jgi:Co/Zn/Cd efflux system component
MRDQVSIAAASPAPELLRRAARLQMLTIVWMSVEAIVASTAAWTARSPALLGFSGDSAIELFSAIIVLWRFRAKSDLAAAEQLAARVAGGLLFVVAAFVVVSSGLSLLGYREAQPTIIGIIVLVVAAIGMPWLASQKRKVATQVASRRNGIRCLWLFVADRFGRTFGKRHFSRSVGRPDSGLGPRPAHREGSMASCPCFATML